MPNVISSFSASCIAALVFANSADAQTVILPIYPDLEIDDQRYVIDCVRDALTRSGARGVR